MNPKLIVLAGAVLVTGVLGWNAYRSFQHSSINEERVEAIAGVENLAIETDISDIRIKPGTGDQMRLHLQGDMTGDLGQYRFDYEKNGDSLTVTFERRSNDLFDLFGILNSSVRLDIELPEKPYKEIFIKSDIGHVEVSNLLADTVRLTTDTGNITGQRIEGREAILQTNLGHLKVRELITSDSANVNTDSGDIRIDRTESPQTTIRTNLGRVDVPEIAGGEVHLSSDSGDLRAGMNSIDRDINVRSNLGNITLAVDEVPAAMQVELESNLGTVSTNFADVNYDHKEEGRLLGSVGVGGPVVVAKTDSGNVALQER